MLPCPGGGGATHVTSYFYSSQPCQTPTSKTCFSPSHLKTDSYCQLLVAVLEQHLHSMDPHCFLKWDAERYNDQNKFDPKPCKYMLFQHPEVRCLLLVQILRHLTYMCRIFHSQSLRKESWKRRMYWNSFNGLVSVAIMRSESCEL
jgi:hypothetical protein